MRDMTQGSIARHLILFVIPMALANIFQQLYNTIDSVIMSRFVGTEALATVSVANPIISIALFLMVGICIGASILLSELFGAGKMEELHREFATSVYGGALFSVAVSVLFILFARPLLRLMNTPQEIMSDATRYLCLIFAGLVFSFLYNIYSSALRAMGDAKMPLVFLAFSAVVQVAVELILVLRFQMGITGAAIATITAQAASAVMCMVYAHRKVPQLRLDPRHIAIDRAMLRITARYSWVSALQQTCLYVGRLLVQGAVNPLGLDAIAAYNAVGRIEAFVLAPGDGLATGITTFVAQNRGGGHPERMSGGVRWSVAIGTVYCTIIAGLLYWKADWFTGLFVPAGNLAAIRLGVGYLTLLAPFYALSSLCNVTQGFFRGVGELKVTVVATFINVGIRTVCSYALVERLGMNAVAWGVAIGWIGMVAHGCWMYFHYKRMHPVTC